MICQNCGADLDEGAKFCRLCGSKLQELDKGVNVVQIKCEINNSVEYKPCQKTEITMITEQGTKDTTDVSGKLVKSRSFLKAGIIITAVILIAVLSKQWIYPDIIVPGIAYAKADKLLKQGAYEEAREQFLKLGEFWNAPEKVQDANNAELKQKYDEAQALMEQGEYLAAEEMFLSLRYFEDAPEKAEKAKNARLEIKYNEAVELMEAGKYSEAISAFSQIVEYKDAASKVKEAQEAYLNFSYEEALQLLNDGDYGAALSAFTLIRDYKDSEEQILEVRYRMAEEKISNKQYYKAAVSFYELAGYKDAWERCFDTWGLITRRSTIGASAGVSVAVRKDGTIAATGLVSWISEVEEWEDIAAIELDHWDIVGLKNSGDVVFGGWNTGDKRDTIWWNDIVAISGKEEFIAGLKADGTVVTEGWFGNRSYDEYDYRNVAEWRDIIAISVGNSHMVGLKCDGTVVAVGSNKENQCNVSNWHDVIAISAMNGCTVGLRADGTIVVTGNSQNKYNFDEWKNIIAIYANEETLVGVKIDGTVISTGNQSLNFSKLSYPLEICIAYSHALGLNRDGTVSVIGRPNSGDTKMDYTEWTEILVVERPEFEFREVTEIKEDVQDATPSSSSEGATITGSIDADLWDFLVNG